MSDHRVSTTLAALLGHSDEENAAMISYLEIGDNLYHNLPEPVRGRMTMAHRLPIVRSTDVVWRARYILKMWSPNSWHPTRTDLTALLASRGYPPSTWGSQLPEGDTGNPPAATPITVLRLPRPSQPTSNTLASRPRQRIARTAIVGPTNTASSPPAHGRDTRAAAAAIPIGQVNTLQSVHLGPAAASVAPMVNNASPPTTPMGEDTTITGSASITNGAKASSFAVHTTISDDNIASSIGVAGSFTYKGKGKAIAVDTTNGDDAAPSSQNGPAGPSPWKGKGKATAELPTASDQESELELSEDEQDGVDDVAEGEAGPSSRKAKSAIKSKSSKWPTNALPSDTVLAARFAAGHPTEAPTLEELMPFYRGETTSTYPVRSLRTPDRAVNPENDWTTSFVLGTFDYQRLVMTIAHPSAHGGVPYTYYLQQVPDFSTPNGVRSLNQWRNQCRRRSNVGEEPRRARVTPYTDGERAKIQDLLSQKIVGLQLVAAYNAWAPSDRSRTQASLVSEANRVKKKERAQQRAAEQTEQEDVEMEDAE